MSIPVTVAVFGCLFSFVWGIYIRGRLADWLQELSFPQIVRKKWEAFLVDMNARIEIETNKRSVQTKIVEAPIPPAVWKKLIKLAHPDKHRSSDLSNEVTKWLLDHRPE